VHLGTASPNTLVQEVVRAAYHGWYQELVEGLPALADGFIAPHDAPGLGITLRPGLRNRVDAHLGVST
jgi:L-alanine-DL-glutamate epimerase-like enolase superfamily enzyme